MSEKNTLAKNGSASFPQCLYVIIWFAGFLTWGGIAEVSVTVTANVTSVAMVLSNFPATVTIPVLGSTTNISWEKRTKHYFLYDSSDVVQICKYIFSQCISNTCMVIRSLYMDIIFVIYCKFSKTNANKLSWMTNSCEICWFLSHLKNILIRMQTSLETNVTITLLF